MRLQKSLSSLLAVLSVTQAAGEEKVLLPAVHWTVSTQDLKHLQASHSHSLYYTEPGYAFPDKRHQFGEVDIKYTIPTINLGHSDHVIANIGEHGAILYFKSPIALTTAYSSWGQLPEILLLAPPSACAPDSAKDHCYILASDLRFNNLTLTVAAKVDRTDARIYAEQASFRWGNYEPSEETSREHSRTVSADSLIQGRSSACHTLQSGGNLLAASPGIGFDKRLDQCHGHKPASSFSWYPYAQSIGAVPGQSSELISTDNLGGDMDVMDFVGADAIAANHDADRGTDTPNAHLLSRETSIWKEWKPEDIPGIGDPVNDKTHGGLSWRFPTDWGSDNSPWGKARLVWKQEGMGGSISVYCVKCGGSGTMDVSGKGIWSRSRGVTQGSVTVESSMDIGYSLGMVSRGNLTIRHNIPIAAHGFPCILFGIVAVGPMVTLGLDLRAASFGNGRMLTGARVITTNSLARLDFEHPNRTTFSGWIPEFVPVTESTGDSTLEIETGLPVGIAFGVSLLNGLYMKSVGLVDRPSLEVKAASRRAGSGAPIRDCSGISTQMSLKNEVYADVEGDKYSLLHPCSLTLARRCHSRHSNLSTIDDQPGSFSVEGFQTISPSKRTYLGIVDSTASYSLAACPHGNIHLFPESEASSISSSYCTQLFVAKGSTVATDGFRRLLVYDELAMNLLGASRLRTHNSEKVPNGSEIVALRPVGKAEGDGGYLMAHDSKGAKFYPVLCGYEKDKAREAQVFLVSNPIKGLEVLTSKASRDTITGGTIKTCQLVPLMLPSIQ